MTEKAIVFKPEHYADMLIKAVETKHMAKKGDFFGVAIYRNEIISTFGEALEAAYEAGKRKGRVDLEEAQIHQIKGNI
jgi:hypothetical protein